MAYGMHDLALNLVGIKQETRSTRRDEFWAVQDVSFDLRRGETLALIGMNGSGKTTLLRLLAGILPPDSGTIVTRGRTGSLIALGAGFHPHMTGRENIFLNGSVLGMSRQEIGALFDSVVAFAEIGDFLEAPVSSYSSGMRVRLGFAIASAVQPEVLLVDEVLAVGDMGFRVKCFNRISEIASETGVVYVSHNVQEVARVCTRAIVMDGGRCVLATDNVAAAIERYEACFHVEKGRISGSGKAELRSIVLYSGGPGQSDDCPEIPFGGALFVDMAIRLDAGVPKCVVTLAFHDRRRAVIAMCMSRMAGTILRNRSGDLRCKAHIPGLRFSPGVYTVTVSIAEPPGEGRGWGEHLARYESVHEFRITGLDASEYGHAPVLLEGEWEQQ